MGNGLVQCDEGSIFPVNHAISISLFVHTESVSERSRHESYRQNGVKNEVVGVQLKV